jgi:predicted nucleic acid-binding protein
MTDWIWDASALHHAALADRLDVLLDLAKDTTPTPGRFLTTSLVVEELTRRETWQLCAPFLEVVDLQSYEELKALTNWLAVVSSGLRSRGEATVFAWAEVHGGLVVVDDKDACRAARRHRLTAHGTLWILAQAIQAGKIPPASADILVEALRKTGARFPSFPAAGGIMAWARDAGLFGGA